MKYFPLVWAALWRKPTRLILTLLAVSAAFTLFGVTIGFNASVENVVKLSRLDRVYVGSRFGGPLPLAYKEQIAHLPGVTKIAHWGNVPGYYRDRKSNAFILMEDDNIRDTYTEMPLTAKQWDQLAASRTGVFLSQMAAARLHVKAGDQFPVLTVAATRADGSKLWPFTVLGVVNDIPQLFAGFIVGNYTYLDESRPIAQRGRVNGIQFLVSDPARAGETARAVDALFSNSPTPTGSISEKDNAEAAAEAGINIPFVTTVVAAAGLFMILFLTGNGIAQSVRERIPEFAMLKTLGFSDAGVMALVFVEAAIPCLLGAGIGIGVSKLLAQQVPHLMPTNLALPVPYMSPEVLSLAFVCAVIMAFISAVIPALRIKRLDVASALLGR